MKMNNLSHACRNSCASHEWKKGVWIELFTEG